MRQLTDSNGNLFTVDDGLLNKWYAGQASGGGTAQTSLGNVTISVDPAGQNDTNLIVGTYNLADARNQFFLANRADVQRSGSQPTITAE